MRLIVLASSSFELAAGLETLGGTGSVLSGLLDVALQAVLQGLAFLFLFFFLRTMTRNQWMAFAVALTLATLSGALPVSGFAPSINIAIGLIHFGIILWVLVRFGLLAFIVTYFVSFVFLFYPMTFQSSAWYASVGYTALAVAAVIAIYGFRTSLGRGRLFELGGRADCRRTNSLLPSGTAPADSPDWSRETI